MLTVTVVIMSTLIIFEYLLFKSELLSYTL